MYNFLILEGGQKSWTGFLFSNSVTFVTTVEPCVVSGQRMVVTRWLYCVKCPQYSIRLEANGYLGIS